MIGPGTGVRVYLACGVTDMRLRIAKLQKLAFGKPSEKIEREIPSWDIAAQCPVGRRNS